MDCPTRMEASAAAIRVGSDTAERAPWIRRARFLAWFAIGHSFLEGHAGIGFSITDESLALLGFDIDGA